MVLFKRRLSPEDIISFKRLCRLCGKDRMHKNHSGKLASQDNFCACCFHCFAMKTFWTDENFIGCFVRQPFWNSGKSLYDSILCVKIKHICICCYASCIFLEKILVQIHKIMKISAKKLWNMCTKLIFCGIIWTLSNMKYIDERWETWFVKKW